MLQISLGGAARMISLLRRAIFNSIMTQQKVAYVNDEKSSQVRNDTTSGHPKRRW
jgi:hypothetical protein